MHPQRVFPTIVKALPVLFLDFSPIIFFVLIAERGDVMVATKVLMIATIVTTVLAFVIHRRVPYITLYITLVTLVFGTLTLRSAHVEYLQLRDTLYDLSLVLFLVASLLTGHLILKENFKNAFTLPDAMWRYVSVLWTGFFLLTAIVNEYIRRAHTFSSWLMYKETMVFVTIFFGVVCFFVALRLAQKNQASL